MDPEPPCSGFFRPALEDTVGCLDAFQASGPLQWVLGNILEAFHSLFRALSDPAAWLDWSEPLAVIDRKSVV